MKAMLCGAGSMLAIFAFLFLVMPPALWVFNLWWHWWLG